MSQAIQVKNLVKKFVFSAKNPNYGIWRNFFAPDKKIITAVNDISFTVDKGEAVAFIGPNGAGKSTCIKILTGILYPTSGHASVLGLNPQRQRRLLSYKIGTVFGQRSQLIFSLPARDSFRLFGKIYELPDKDILRREQELTEIFEIDDILDQPVRKLSLGQRMRAEIAVSLIHRPEIIFLDEPTIGLDIVAKQKLRHILLRLNQDQKTTIFLTSHDAGDIEALCQRTVIVNNGQIILDMPTDSLQKEYLTHKNIRVEYTEPTSPPKLKGLKLIKSDGVFAEFVIDTKQHSLNETLKEILNRHEVKDIDVENSSLEEVISSIYQSH